MIEDNKRDICECQMQGACQKLWTNRWYNMKSELLWRYNEAWGTCNTLYYYLDTCVIYFLLVSHIKHWREEKDKFFIINCEFLLKFKANF